MNDVDVLKSALALIENADRWTQNTYARNDMGLSVPPDSPDARNWCLSGAILRCTEYLHQWQDLIVLIESVLRQQGMYLNNDPHEPCESQLVSFYNDTQSHEDIVLLLKSTIHQLETAQ